MAVQSMSVLVALVHSLPERWCPPFRLCSRAVSVERSQQPSLRQKGGEYRSTQVLVCEGVDTAISVGRARHSSLNSSLVSS